MSIIIKGKFIKWSGYAGEGQIDPTATIELYSPTYDDLDEGQEVLVKMKVARVFGKAVGMEKYKEAMDIKDVVAILPQPQQLITNNLCDTCITECASRNTIGDFKTCNLYKPVCDCKEPMNISSFREGEQIYGHCGKTIRPKPKPELASDKEDELENILICFGENFGEVRLEDIDKYVREGKEKILALVGKN